MRSGAESSQYTRDNHDNPVEKLILWHEHGALTALLVNSHIIVGIVHNCNQFKPIGSGEGRSELVRI